MHQEIEHLKKFPDWAKKLWAASLGIILSFLFGFLVGVLNTEWRIIDDCKFGSVFRIGTQAYNCIRKI